jgi:hypothetical protein
MATHVGSCFCKSERNRGTQSATGAGYKSILAIQLESVQDHLWVILSAILNLRFSKS